MPVARGRALGRGECRAHIQAMGETGTPHEIFDRRSVRRHRDRAAARMDRCAEILEAGAALMADRLDDVTRRFSRALEIGGRGFMAPRLRARGIETVCCDLSGATLRRSGAGGVVADEEWLPFAAGSFDLIVASLSLHWVNDLPGALLQLRQALQPDGLFLASLPVLPTLGALRAALLSAETALRGGASPRVSPFPELRDCARLLQRAGFALPVADAERLELRYRSGLALLRDLAAAGEANALLLRDRRIPHSGLFPAAVSLLEADLPFACDLHLAILTGWAPSPDQPKPLRPGQFAVPLAEALEDRSEALLREPPRGPHDED